MKNTHLLVTTAVGIFFWSSIAISAHGGHGKGASHEQGEDHYKKEQENSKEENSPEKPSKKEENSKDKDNEQDNKDEHAKATEETAVPIAKLSFTDWLKEKIMGSFEKKWTAAMSLDMDNDFLRARVAELELENAILIYKANSCTEISKATEIKTHAKQEGGFEASRTVASLDSRSTQSVEGEPRVIFEKATKAFSEEDYEVAAKNFISLVSDPKNKSYQKAETYFFAGISLYELKNFKKSAEYLKKSEELARVENKGAALSFAPRSMAWLALAYDKLGNSSESKKIVHELVQKFPKSHEAQRYISNVR